jgi:CheY-like chemotaxis protein
MGLGLSLVHSLVTLQGGTVTADSPGEGQGATFTLSFPIIALMEPAVGPTNGVSHSHRLVEQDSLKNIKILLVEDGNETRLALEHLLASQGATVRAEASAQDGLATFKSFHPDVIVSDIAMPQEDGHTMLRKIRSLSVAEGATTPAIALTAYAEPRDREQAFASGFQEYLNKPVDSSVLSHAILKLSKSKPARLQSEIDCRIQSVEHRELGPSPSPA